MVAQPRTLTMMEACYSVLIKVPANDGESHKEDGEGMCHALEPPYPWESLCWVRLNQVKSGEYISAKSH